MYTTRTFIYQYPLHAHQQWQYKLCITFQLRWMKMNFLEKLIRRSQPTPIQSCPLKALLTDILLSILDHVSLPTAVAFSICWKQFHFLLGDDYIRKLSRDDGSLNFLEFTDLRSLIPTYRLSNMLPTPLHQKCETLHSQALSSSDHIQEKQKPFINPSMRAQGLQRRCPWTDKSRHQLNALPYGNGSLEEGSGESAFLRVISRSATHVLLQHHHNW